MFHRSVNNQQVVERKCDIYHYHQPIRNAIPYKQEVQFMALLRDLAPYLQFQIPENVITVL